MLSRYQYYYQPLKISYWLTTNLITNCLLGHNKKTECSYHFISHSGPSGHVKHYSERLSYWDFGTGPSSLRDQSQRLTLLDNKRPNSCLAPQITWGFHHLLCMTDVKKIIQSLGETTLVMASNRSGPLAPHTHGGLQEVCFPESLGFRPRVSGIRTGVKWCWVSPSDVLRCCTETGPLNNERCCKNGICALTIATAHCTVMR